MQPFYETIIQLDEKNAKIHTFIRSECIVKKNEISEYSQQQQQGQKLEKESEKREREEDMEGENKSKKLRNDEEDNSSEQEAMQLLFQQIAHSIQSIASDQSSPNPPQQNSNQPPPNPSQYNSQKLLEEPELFKAMQSILGSITGDLRSTMTIKDENVQTDIETFRCR